MNTDCSYILSCCSTADVSEEFLNSRDIKYVCFHYSLDDQVYVDDLGKSMTPQEMYTKMLAGAETKTSQVNVDEFINYFTPMLEAGKDIFHATLSSGISGVLNSAQVAATELREQFPDRTIVIVDTLSASAGYGLIMDKLADLRDEGYSITELEKWFYDNRVNQNTWFFSTDLTFFVKGGRISKASGWFGTALNICPLLNVNNEGKLVPRTKCRGKKLVKKTMVSTMKDWIAVDPAEYSEGIFITHSDCYEDARDVADMIEAEFPNIKYPVKIFNIGPTIGSHTGPGTVALGFWGKPKQA